MSSQKPPAQGRRFADWMAIALLLVLSLAFFYRLVLGNLVMAGLDVFTYFYPYKAYAAEAIRSGSLPLWNPYLFMGVPFLANIQSAVLYPLNFLFYWLPAPEMVNWSIVLHVFIAGACTYGFARHALRFGQGSAVGSAVILSFGGFLGAQLEHINQLSVLVWLPLLLWLAYLSYTTRRLIYVLLTGVVVGVQFLGGHTQSSYINLVALGCYCLYLPLAQPIPGRAARSPGLTVGRSLLRSLAMLAAVVLLGLGLAGMQLVPTYELSRLSIRSAGLPYRQAVSFSLNPAGLHRALLPGLAENPFSEYVAYVGLLPLLLALLAVWRRRGRQQSTFFLAISGLGLFLALGVYNPLYYLLYRLVPGFGLFRVPARWLYLYVVGTAFLAGLGLEELGSLSGRFVRPGKRLVLLASALAVLLVSLAALDPPSPAVASYWVVWTVASGALIWAGLRSQRGVRYRALVVCLIVGELFLASSFLPYNRLTVPEAFSSMRSSVAHFLTDDSVFRVLSYSDGSFDPGDLRTIQENLGAQLPEEAVYDYLVATKQKEILTPNLPLLYRVESIDGYDGGILPLARYVAWQRLLLPEDQISVDGRLRGRITEMPDADLLDMWNVKYVMTDKVYDVWVDGAYYDLGQRAVLGGAASDQLVLDDLPSFQATGLGVVSYLLGAEDVPQGTVVAEITIVDDQGRRYGFELRAGEDTAQGEYSASTPLHEEARVVGHWRGSPEGNDYHTELDWGEAIHPAQITVDFVADRGQLRLRGMTLLDRRTGTHRALMVSTEGDYRLAHSGDVKIYENLDVLPRAFVVHEAQFLPDDDAALAALAGEAFDPARQVLLVGDSGSPESYGAGCEDEVRMVSYAPERISMEASTSCQGYLVLTDAYYPGWVALVDGEPQQILRANQYFRAVSVPEGQHTVEFRYQPGSLKVGFLLSVAAMVLVVGGAAWELVRSRRSAG